jgi:DNA-binding NarL/FixJ family response regulator
MPVRSTLAIVAGRPGPLQDSLVALITTMHEVNSVLIAEDAASALRMAAQHRPALAVVEMDLEREETHTVLEEIKSRWPSMGCIALADGARQRREAESAGADVVLVKGFKASAFVAAVEGLLCGEQESDHSKPPRDS